MRRLFTHILIISFAVYLLSWMPFIYLLLTSPVIEELTMASPTTTEPLIVPRGIVFGGLYTNGEPMSELNQERLLAAIELYKQGTIQTIVVSNTKDASLAMQQYLVDRDIPKEKIELDTQADITEDSCIHQATSHPDEYTVLISHRYHLPRALHLCSKHGVEAMGYPAELIRTGPSQSTWLEKMSIRAWRYQREAVLLDLSLLGLYK